MSETTEATTDAATETSGDNTETEATATGTTEAAEVVDYKSKFEAQQKVNRDLERKFKESASAKDERDALQAKLDGKEAEFTAQQEKAAVKAEALAAANQRILRSEVKAAAKGVLADPADAYKFIDLDSFEVGDDGDVDEAAIKAALEDLISKKPYLGVTESDAKRFKGTGDGGPKGNAGKPQLTEADVKRMSSEGKHAEIEQARLDGRLNTMLGIT